MRGLPDHLSALSRSSLNSVRLACRGTRDALDRHRHGTWLLLFAILFALLWLLAGWGGMPNSAGRGMLVGTATGLAVSRLVPLRRRPVPVKA